jgi:hypothetical protein
MVSLHFRSDRTSGGSPDLDFCLWGPATPNSLIGDVEGECVAWCTKATHGKQFPFDNRMVTPNFLSLAGKIEPLPSYSHHYAEF